MSHVRQQLRSQIVVALLGQTSAVNNVFTNRSYPLSQSELPALIVFTETEEIQNTTISDPVEQLRSVDLRINAYVEAISGVENVADSLCVDVEKALAQTNTIARSIILEGTSGMRPNVIGEAPVMEVTMSFLAHIVTLSDDPETAL